MPKKWEWLESPLRFSEWFCWEDKLLFVRGDLPGVYLIARGEANGRAAASDKRIIYIGQTLHLHSRLLDFYGSLFGNTARSHIAGIRLRAYLEKHYGTFRKEWKKRLRLIFAIRVCDEAKETLKKYERQEILRAIEVCAEAEFVRANRRLPILNQGTFELKL